MKFAVGDKVTINNSRSRSLWKGIKAKVTRVDPQEKTYPYEVALLEDTKIEAFRSGEVVDAWREDELTLTSEVVQSDIEEAKALLQKHGLAFRIYTREDVDKLLDVYATDDNDPTDTRTFREEIVEFIMNGKDWPDLSSKGFDDDTMLWMMVEGARNDHPEWFVG